VKGLKGTVVNGSLEIISPVPLGLNLSNNIIYAEPVHFRKIMVHE